MTDIPVNDRENNGLVPIEENLFLLDSKIKTA
jgi:hypothetical protein